MAKIHKLEEKVELNCPAEKIFEMLRAKQSDIPEICSDKVPSIKVHQGDWLSVGSTRKWDLNIGEKSTYIIDRIDAIDEENMKITRSVIEGEIMTHYKSLVGYVQAIPKGNDNKSCIFIGSLEYEKINEDAPEPKEFLNFGIGVIKELGHSLNSVVN
ncbi:MLP-like protein 43 [Silene latifolia]|uniref:MLP-like protein 43 n=1 Tax=Silene latifolia TaxID=37657 RepID=UPI003D781E62